MRVWRALKAMRAAVLRDGVYLLPNRKDLLGALEAQAVDVGRQSGSAQIFMIDSRDERQEAEFRNLFDRTSDYQSTVKKIRKLRADLKSKTPRAISAQLMRLRREVETIAGQDFFPAEAANQSARALEELTVAAGRLLSPDEPQSVERKMRRLDPNKHKGRIWATRARPWADRLASAWLIRRFIDPDARFLWLKNPGDCPKRALGFDFDGAAFTHVGGKVTFEVLMESFNLDADSRLHRVAALIHYLDVGGIPVPEAAGVESLLRAARELFANDDVLLGEAAKIFELLYISYGDLDGDRN